jgi:hypothetical protein
MLIGDFLDLCDAAALALGIREATLSTRMLGDGKRLAAIRRGKDIGVRRLEAAVDWIAANWPRESPRSPLLPSRGLENAGRSEASHTEAVQ